MPDINKRLKLIGGSNTNYVNIPNPTSNTPSSSAGYPAALQNLLSGDDTTSKIILASIILFILYVTINLGIYLYKYIAFYSKGKPWLYKKDHAKDAKKRLVIKTIKNKKESFKKVWRSVNQVEGLEFTYVCWIYIDDWNYKFGSWKHILHKGNENSWPGRAPGIWLHPEVNNIRVYMNTFNKIADYADITNIPVDKWFHLSVQVTDRYLDIYLNGHLKKRHILDGIPRQNYGDIYINSFGGFSGWMSKIRYYDRAISTNELESIVREGPSNIKQKTYDKPPYLATNWWINNYN